MAKWKSSPKEGVKITTIETDHQEKVDSSFILGTKPRSFRDRTERSFHLSEFLVLRGSIGTYRKLIGKTGGGTCLKTPPPKAYPHHNIGQAMIAQGQGWRRSSIWGKLSTFTSSRTFHESRSFVRLLRKGEPSSVTFQAQNCGHPNACALGVL